MNSGFPDDLYEVAMRAIAPSRERALECRTLVAGFVALLADQSALPKPPSPAELRRKLIALEAHLKGTRAALADLGPIMPMATLGPDTRADRIAALETWIRSLRPFIGDGYGIIVERPRPRPKPLAYLACESAFTLLADYSPVHPVGESSVIELAEALLAAAEVRGVPVDRAAQHVVRRRRELEELNRQRRTAEK